MTQAMAFRLILIKTTIFHIRKANGGNIVLSTAQLGV